MGIPERRLPDRAKAARRGLILALLAGPALAGEPPRDAPAYPYYACMVEAVQDYASKTDRADDAIAAADARCEPLMLDAIEAVVAARPAASSDYLHQRRVRAAARTIRARLRPDFVAAFLQAR